MKRKKQVVVYSIFFFMLGIATMLGLISAFNYTSTDKSCQMCHVHDHAADSWMLSSHVNNESGVKVHCVDCHLPPKGVKRWKSKVYFGVKDLWVYLTKDSAEIDWASKRQLENAVKYIPNESCKECHQNLFPKNISDDGITAHLHYQTHEKEKNLQCISCHLNAGHQIEGYAHEQLTGIPQSEQANDTVYQTATTVEQFTEYIEEVPSTNMSFTMKPIEGGTFKMGTPEEEPFSRADERPMREVTVSPFFMAEIEVTWDLYWAFYSETFSEGRTPPETVYNNNTKALGVDGMSGPTPPFGYPDQGWGFGNRPAITMTYYAAQTFCQWLSLKTGKNYRLPTEAEWEYAARGGTQTPYFFEGNPKDYSTKGFWRKFFKADTTTINSYVNYMLNSKHKTHLPNRVMANPFGLKNMLGNVMEYCSDYYAEDAYAQTPTKITDPQGPTQGKEHVVRGGDYASDAAELRCGSRGQTHHDEWLITDPQQPKSIWWFSDVKSIGFRVVCSKKDAMKGN